MRPMMKLKSQLQEVESLSGVSVGCSQNGCEKFGWTYATPLARRLEGKTSDGIAHGTGPYGILLADVDRPS